jgi:hypothetical protein
MRLRELGRENDDCLTLVCCQGEHEPRTGFQQTPVEEHRLAGEGVALL